MFSCLESPGQPWTHPPPTQGLGIINLVSISNMGKQLCGAWGGEGRRGLQEPQRPMERRIKALSPDSIPNGEPCPIPSP